MIELLKFAKSQGITVKFKPLKYNDGLYAHRQNEYRIALREELKKDTKKAEYILAHELAHHFLHKDKGDTVKSDKHEEYEEQADRAAEMLLKFIELLKKEIITCQTF